MKITKFWILSAALIVNSGAALAQKNDEAYAQYAPVTVTVTDVTQQYALASPTPTPQPGQTLPPPGGTVGTGTGTGLGSGCSPFDPTCLPIDPPIYNPGIGSGHFDLSTLITIGQKVWDFINAAKPDATYQTLKASVLPGGATNWAQLKGWKKPVSKVFHVEFKNVFNKPVGGFDYRIVFIYGGSYQGKGKYIGQLSFVPLNVKLNTDFKLDVRAELLDALNFGTEDDPVAGAQLQITWHTSTTLRYSMNSIEYFVYGTGEIQDISNGNVELQ